MAVNDEAAFHEAGHAVAAYWSRYHSLIRRVSLQDYGAGQTYISLSKKKLAAESKPVSSAMEADADVTSDYVVILSAGLVAEEIAEELEDGITANELCACQDREFIKQRLLDAGLAPEPARYETEARKLLRSRWGQVVGLASLLYRNVETDAVDVIEFLECGCGRDA